MMIVISALTSLFRKVISKPFGNNLLLLVILVISVYHLSLSSVVGSELGSAGGVSQSLSSCSSDDKESLVPFPPSIQPLEYLKLLEYNGPEFRLSCELLVCSITKPIK